MLKHIEKYWCGGSMMTRNMAITTYRKNKLNTVVG